MLVVMEMMLALMQVNVTHKHSNKVRCRRESFALDSVGLPPFDFRGSKNLVSLLDCENSLKIFAFECFPGQNLSNLSKSYPSLGL